MMHPIKQLTAGSSSHGSRARISWDEFLNQSELKLPVDHDPAAAPPRMDTSATMSGLVLPTFDCPRAQEMHQMLQHRRADCLEHFNSDIAHNAEQKRYQFSVARQMWDRSADVPAMASEWLAASSDEFAREPLIVRMKEWHQHCKDEGHFKWHIEKRRWLESDLEIVKQHTQALKDEVQRFRDVKKRCKEISNEIRGGSSRLQHLGQLQDIKQAYQHLGNGELKRMHDERQLIQRALPEEQAELDSATETNIELERKVLHLKLQVQAEETERKETHKAALQQQVRRANLEKQFYAHTSIIHKATPGAVCLQMRGNVKVWVEKTSHQDVVRLSAQQSQTLHQPHPYINIAPDFSHSLLACAWYRILAIVMGSSGPKLSCPILDTDKRLEATVPCQELHRFLRLFDVEVIRITDQLRAMRNLSKEIPEIARVSALFCNSPKGDQPTAVLSVLLSILCSHSVHADGAVRPLSSDAKAGAFNAVECTIKFNADLATLPDVRWSAPIVEHAVGRLDTTLVAQAAQSAQNAASHSSFCEVVTAAARAMKHAASTVR
jgi:hypothetical protein